MRNLATWANARIVLAAAVEWLGLAAVLVGVWILFPPAALILGGAYAIAQSGVWSERARRRRQ